MEKPRKLTATAITEILLPAIAGHDVTEIAQLHARMDRVLRGYPYAKAAIDVALHDAIGKIYGVPVYQLLGGKVRDGTAIAHSIGIMEADAAAREAAEVIAEGVTTIKVKIGVEADRDIAVVAAVRQAIGSAGKIRVDANQGYRTWREAVRVISAMEKYDIVYAEQPVEGLRAHGGGQRAHQCPGHGRRERLDRRGRARDRAPQCRADAFGLLHQAGRPRARKRLLAVAGAAALPCDINGSAEMGIGVAADLHLAASSPEIVLPGTIPVTSTAETVVTKVAGHKYLDDLIKTPFRFDEGIPLRAGRARPRHRGRRGEDREVPHRLMPMRAIKTIAIIGAEQRRLRGCGAPDATRLPTSGSTAAAPAHDRPVARHRRGRIRGRAGRRLRAAFAHHQRCRRRDRRRRPRADHGADPRPRRTSHAPLRRTSRVSSSSWRHRATRCC